MAIRESETFQRDGVAVRVCPRTPRTDMTFRSVLVKLASKMDEWVNIYDVNMSDIDMSAYEFAMIASRASIEGDIDFMLPSARDDEKTVQAAFTAYLETDYMGVVDQLLTAVRKQDKPVSDTTAPTPPDDSKKK